MQVIKGKYNVAKVMIDEIDAATREQVQGFVNHPAFGGRHQIVIAETVLQLQGIGKRTQKMSGSSL